jgi:DNA helicase-2/ATP-dependent DNA helicase PcrA
VLEELISNAPNVAVALKNLFSQKGNVYIENWVEMPFNGNHLRGQKVEVMIHGKLDAVVEQGDKIFVYDYKTREAMSPNAIKGEAYSSDGNYFRQLVFYKILLEGNSRFKNKLIEPALVFVKPDSKGRCPVISLPIGKSDTEKVKSEISSLLESVWSGKFLNQTCDDKTCQYCGYRKLALQNQVND